MTDRYTFLGELASNILQHDAVSPKDVLIILPNKRAKRVLQKHIAQRISTPQFSPQILSINEFFESLSPLKSITKEELLLHLYSIFVTLDSFQEESFQTFLTWAPTFLSDINEIDLQLADASQIYSNLSEIKELETTFLKGELSEFQNKYLHFYIQLGELYEQFIAYLKENKIGYEGLIYRNVAEQIIKVDQLDDQLIAPYKGFKRFIFAGFHALSPSEMSILEFFYHKFQGEFLFDIDRFYDEKYAPFVKTLQNRLRIPDIHIKEDFRNIPKEVFITEVTGNMSQIYHAIDLIHHTEKVEGTLDETALVFADESLIVPFVHAYDCTKANLTMGYPIQNTTAYQLLQIILDLTKNSFRFAKIQQVDQKIYYHKDLVLFFQNPLVAQSLLGGGAVAYNVVKDIVANNQIFISQKEISPIIPNLPAQGVEIIHLLLRFFDDLSHKVELETPDYYGIQLVIKGLNNTLTIFENPQFTSLLLDFNSIEYFIYEKVNALSIPFMGDFDKGLQVCGLLETRTLDYKNIIFLSINEGVLPKGKGQPSMIMYDVKNHFKLPTSTYKDSIFAYHFFRLMQRASLVHILYDNDSSSTLAEKSRFINQLEFEVEHKKLNGNIKIVKRTINTIPQIKTLEDNAILIPKDQHIIKKLQDFKFSASNLTTFIRCPLAFYLTHIEKLEQIESVDENIENKVVGTIIHAMLQSVFDKIEKDHTKAISIIDTAIADIDLDTKKAFIDNKEISKADITRGKLYLATEVVKRNVLAYLNISKKEFLTQDIQVVGNEVVFQVPLSTGFGDVILKGAVDRIDIRDHKVTILDYKTGRVDPKELILKSEENLITDYNQKQLFQLLVYLLLYQKDPKNTLVKTESYSSGIIAFQDVLLQNETYIHYAQLPLAEKSTSTSITTVSIDHFEKIVIQLLEQILNPELPFIQTKEIKNCQYCDFKSICKK